MAQLCYTDRLLIGRGVAQDAACAVSYWRPSAEQGVGAAQMRLGAAYEQGQGGLAQSSQETMRLYQLAAQQGLIDATRAVERMQAALQ